MAAWLPVLGVVGAFLAAVLGGGGALGLWAHRQNRAADAAHRRNAAQVESGQLWEKWAAGDRADRNETRAELRELTRSHDHLRTQALICPGGFPCPTRPAFLAGPPPEPGAAELEAACAAHAEGVAKT